MIWVKVSLKYPLTQTSVIVPVVIGVVVISECNLCNWPKIVLGCYTFPLMKLLSEFPCTQTTTFYV